MITFSGLSYKTKQFFFVLIKLCIVVGASCFIYNKLINNDELEFSVFIRFLAENDVFSTKNVFFLLFLTVFNWFFEILKWQNLVSFVKKLSFLEALKQSLASHTASLFTPNRIGDYAAKSIYFNNDLRKKVVFLNLVGNMAQMLITVLFGIVGFIIFTSQYQVDISYYKLVRLLTYTLVFFVIIYFVLTYKRFHIKGFSVKKIKTFVKSIPIIIQLKNFLFSMFRYLIFSFQFYFLLLLFKADITYLNALVIISSMHLLVSIIPTIFVFDLIIKGSVALFLFDHIGINNLTILSVTTLMWLLNFVLPSVFGSYYVLNFNMSENSNLDD